MFMSSGALSSSPGNSIVAAEKLLYPDGVTPRRQYGRSAENSRSDVPLGSDPDAIKLPKSGLLPPNGGYWTVRRGLSSCRITRMTEQTRLTNCTRRWACGIDNGG